MKSTYRIITIALAATSVLAASAQAMPARDAGHWTETAARVAPATSYKSHPQLRAHAVIARRGPLAI